MNNGRYFEGLIRLGCGAFVGIYIEKLNQLGAGAFTPLMWVGFILNCLTLIGWIVYDVFRDEKEYTAYKMSQEKHTDNNSNS